jgi:hypothetical protein
MRKIIINCAIAVLALGSAAAPAMADSVTVTRERAYDGYDRYDRYDHDRVRPGVTISDRGITFGAVRERDRDRCVTRSVTRQTDEGTVTKTVRRCD